MQVHWLCLPFGFFPDASFDEVFLLKLLLYAFCDTDPWLVTVIAHQVYHWKPGPHWDSVLPNWSALNLSTPASHVCRARNSRIPLGFQVSMVSVEFGCSKACGVFVFPICPNVNHAKGDRSWQNEVLVESRPCLFRLILGTYIIIYLPAKVQLTKRLFQKRYVSNLVRTSFHNMNPYPPMNVVFAPIVSIQKTTPPIPSIRPARAGEPARAGPAGLPSASSHPQQKSSESLQQTEEEGHSSLEDSKYFSQTVRSAKQQKPLN